MEPEYQKMEKETTDTDGLERDEEYAGKLCTIIKPYYGSQYC